MSRLRNGGAEEAPGAVPLVLGAAEIRDDLGSTSGLKCWNLPASRQTVPNQSSTLQWLAVPTVPGVRYTLAMMVRGLSASAHQRLAFGVDPAGGTNFFLVNFTVPAGVDWFLWETSFTASGISTSIQLACTVTSGFEAGSIQIDDVELEPEMAVFLSEFAVRAVIARLQAALNTEIGYIESESNLGLDLPLVTGWRGYDAGIATPDVVEAEVYEIGDLTFPAEEYSKSQWSAGVRTRVISELPIRAAINHANRGNADAATPDTTLTASQMATRSRLYELALVRTIRNDPTCGQSANLTIVPRAARSSSRDVARIGNDIRRAGRAEFDFIARLQESSANETTPGGGNLPAATLETP